MSSSASSSGSRSGKRRVGGSSGRRNSPESTSRYLSEFSQASPPCLERSEPSDTSTLPTSIEGPTAVKPSYTGEAGTRHPQVLPSAAMPWHRHRTSSPLDGDVALQRRSPPVALSSHATTKSPAAAASEEISPPLRSRTTVIPLVSSGSVSSLSVTSDGPSLPSTAVVAALAAGCSDPPLSRLNSVPSAPSGTCYPPFPSLPTRHAARGTPSFSPATSTGTDTRNGHVQSSTVGIGVESGASRPSTSTSTSSSRAGIQTDNRVSPPSGDVAWRHPYSFPAGWSAFMRGISSDHGNGRATATRSGCTAASNESASSAVAPNITATFLSSHNNSHSAAQPRERVVNLLLQPSAEGSVTHKLSSSPSKEHRQRSASPTRSALRNRTPLLISTKSPNTVAGHTKPLHRSPRQLAREDSVEEETEVDGHAEPQSVSWSPTVPQSVTSFVSAGSISDRFGYVESVPYRRSTSVRRGASGNHLNLNSSISSTPTRRKTSSPVRPLSPMHSEPLSESPTTTDQKAVSVPLTGLPTPPGGSTPAVSTPPSSATCFGSPPFSGIRSSGGTPSLTHEKTTPSWCPPPPCNHSPHQQRVAMRTSTSSSSSAYWGLPARSPHGSITVAGQPSHSFSLGTTELKGVPPTEAVPSRTADSTSFGMPGSHTSVEGSSAPQATHSFASSSSALVREETSYYTERSSPRSDQVSQDQRDSTIERCGASHSHPVAQPYPNNHTATDEEPDHGVSVCWAVNGVAERQPGGSSRVRGSAEENESSSSGAVATASCAGRVGGGTFVIPTSVLQAASVQGSGPRWRGNPRGRLMMDSGHSSLSVIRTSASSLSIAGTGERDVAGTSSLLDDGASTPGPTPSRTTMDLLLGDPMQSRVLVNGENIAQSGALHEGVSANGTPMPTSVRLELSVAGTGHSTTAVRLTPSSSEPEEPRVPLLCSSPQQRGGTHASVVPAPPPPPSPLSTSTPQSGAPPWPADPPNDHSCFPFPRLCTPTSSGNDTSPSNAMPALSASREERQRPCTASASSAHLAISDPRTPRRNGNTKEDSCTMSSPLKSHGAASHRAERTRPHISTSLPASPVVFASHRNRNDVNAEESPKQSEKTAENPSRAEPVATARRTGLPTTISCPAVSESCTAVGGHHLALKCGRCFLKETGAEREEAFYEAVCPYQEQLVQLSASMPSAALAAYSHATGWVESSASSIPDAGEPLPNAVSHPSHRNPLTAESSLQGSSSVVGEPRPLTTSPAKFTTDSGNSMFDVPKGSEHWWKLHHRDTFCTYAAAFKAQKAPSKPHSAAASSFSASSTVNPLTPQGGVSTSLKAIDGHHRAARSPSPRSQALASDTLEQKLQCSQDHFASICSVPYHANGMPARVLEETSGQSPATVNPSPPSISATEVLDPGLLSEEVELDEEALYQESKREALSLIASFIPLYRGKAAIAILDPATPDDAKYAVLTPDEWSVIKTQQTTASSAATRHPVYMEMIVLEDVCHCFQFPCVLDIKMGNRQYGLKASAKKRESKMLKAHLSTSAQHGIRLAGYKKYDPSTASTQSRSKLECRYLTLEELHSELCAFLAHNRSLEIRFRHQIERLRSAFSQQRVYRFYTSSLLFVYDAQRPVDTARIVMIDFAFTYERRELLNERDEEAPFEFDVGYLRALDTLLSLLA